MFRDQFQDPFRNPFQFQDPFRNPFQFQDPFPHQLRQVFITVLL
jgi:hypothetical protein